MILEFNDKYLELKHIVLRGIFSSVKLIRSYHSIMHPVIEKFKKKLNTVKRWHSDSLINITKKESHQIIESAYLLTKNAQLLEI